MGKSTSHIAFKLIVVSALFVACKKDEGPTNPTLANPGVIQPLKLGNSWTYRITEPNTYPNPYVYTGTERVISDTTTNNERWYRVSPALYYANRSNGLWAWTDLYQDTTSRSLVAMFPASVGDTVTSVNSQPTIVVSIDENVIVPSGSYRCYHYQLRFSTGQVELDRYYAPGVGEVKWVSYTYLGPWQIGELQSVTLN